MLYMLDMYQSHEILAETMDVHPFGASMMLSLHYFPHTYNAIDLDCWTKVKYVFTYWLAWQRCMHCMRHCFCFLVIFCFQYIIYKAVIYFYEEFNLWCLFIDYRVITVVACDEIYWQISVMWWEVIDLELTTISDFLLCIWDTYDHGIVIPLFFFAQPQYHWVLPTRSINTER